MTIIAALLLFGVIVLIHEFGHFIFAKKNGVTVHEFALGMGPKLFGKEVNGTMYYAKNYNVYLNVLAKYINQKDFISYQISNYVYDYIKTEYLPSHSNINISDVDNKTILSIVKNKYPDSGCSDAELLDIINIQITSILVEQLEQGN